MNTTNTKRKLLFLLLAAFLLAGCATKTEHEPIEDPHQIDNFHAVDSKLYRSGQPSKSGFASLHAFGISNDFDLRLWHDDAALLEGSGIKHFRFPLNASKVTYEDLVHIVATIQSQNTKSLVHCYHGSDRTGVIVAAYRISNGWSKEKAVDEFVNGGYGYHEFWFPNLQKLLESIDEKKFRADVKRYQQGLK